MATHGLEKRIKKKKKSAGQIGKFISKAINQAARAYKCVNKQQRIDLTLL